MVVGLRQLKPLPFANALAKKISLYCGYASGHYKVYVRHDSQAVEVDAIVNAANKTLLGGGGVDGAIHKAANDPRFLEECRQLRGCETGEAKSTQAYQLPCKGVIHTVGPIYSQHSPAQARTLLQAAYRHSLQQAVQHQWRTVAFPSISTGVYGYPIEDATHAVLEQVKSFLQTDEGRQVDLVVFCCFSASDLGVYERLAPMYFGP